MMKNLVRNSGTCKTVYSSIIYYMKTKRNKMQLGKSNGLVAAFNDKV